MKEKRKTHSSPNSLKEKHGTLTLNLLKKEKQKP